MVAGVAVEAKNFGQCRACDELSEGRDGLCGPAADSSLRKRTLPRVEDQFTFGITMYNVKNV
jgi:hypothetical protein